MSEEQIKIESTENFTEIFEVPLQNRMRAFWYLVGVNGGEYVTIIAPNATEAKNAIEQQFSGCTHHFLAKCDLIMQVNTGTHLQEV